MKKLAMTGGLLCLLATWAVCAMAPANFSGEWSLDKSKSEPAEQMANGPDITLTITQDDKQLTVETKRSGGQGGGPGGGGGGGGQGGGGMGGGGGQGGGGGRGMGGPQKLTYGLDGKKTTMEVPNPNGASTIDLEAKWNGEQKLELKNVRHLNFQGNPVDFTTTETWELADGGKTLKINRTSESPRGKMESKMVFVKK